MNRSESISELIPALAKAQGEFTGAVKDSENPAFKSKYADLSSVINAVRPALNKHGIVLLQVSESDLERQTASVTTSLHLGDQWLSATAEAPAKGMGDKFNVQTLGAAWTYLKRYTLQGLLGLPSEDDDGNTLTADSKPIPARSKPQPIGISITIEEAAKVLLCAGVDVAKLDTLDSFNDTVIPLMKGNNRDLIIAASTIAKDRKYTPNRTTGLYEAPKEDAHV